MKYKIISNNSKNFEKQRKNEIVSAKLVKATLSILEEIKSSVKPQEVIYKLIKYQYIQELRDGEGLNPLSRKFPAPLQFLVKNLKSPIFWPKYNEQIALFLINIKKYDFNLYKWVISELVVDASFQKNLTEINCHNQSIACEGILIEILYQTMQKGNQEYQALKILLSNIAKFNPKKIDIIIELIEKAEEIARVEYANAIENSRE